MTKLGWNTFIDTHPNNNHLVVFYTRSDDLRIPQTVSPVNSKKYPTINKTLEILFRGNIKGDWAVTREQQTQKSITLKNYIIGFADINDALMAAQLLQLKSRTGTVPANYTAFVSCIVCDQLSAQWYVKFCKNNGYL